MAGCARRRGARAPLLVHGFLTARLDIPELLGNEVASLWSRHQVSCVMWFDEAFAVVHSIGVTVVKILPVSIALAAAFTVLSYFFACNPGQPWWRKRELVTDLDLLVHYPAVCPLPADRAAGDGCGVPVQHQYRGRAGRLL